MADWVIKHNLLEHHRKWLQRLKKMPDVMARILRDTAKYMTRETKRRFDKQVSPDGMPWKPLDPLTKKARKKGAGRAGSGHKALLDTGTGKRSIVPEIVSRNVAKVGPGEQFNVFYLAFHQSGFRSAITKKQAWWMVFNLYGFDPEKPWRFGRGGEPAETKVTGFFAIHGGQLVRGTESKVLKESAKRSLGFLGWRTAAHLANKLKNSTLTISPRPFAGINKENADEMENIALKNLDKAWRIRASS